MIKKKKYLSLLVAVTMLATLAFPLGASASAAPVAAVMGFSMGSSTINAGQTVTFNVSTTAGANNVVVAYDGKTATATAGGSASSAVKSWTVSFAPAKTQNVQLLVSASADVTNAATLNIPITVVSSGTGGGGTINPTIPTPTTPATPVAPRPTQSSVTISDDITETSSGKTVTLTIRTNAAANNVWINYDSDKYTQATPVSTEGDVKTWSVQFNPSQIQMVKISANTSYKTNGAANKDFTIEFTSSIAPPATASITSATTSAATINYNSNVDVTIRTNVDAQYVWVDYDGTSTDASLKSETRSSKTWTVRISPEETQTMTAYANTTDTAEGAAHRDVRITVRSSNSGYYDNNYYYNNRYLSATANISWYNGSSVYGGNGTFTVSATTSPYMNYVRFLINGAVVASLNRTGTGSSGEYLWTYSVTNASMTTYNYSSITVQACETPDFASPASQTVNVSGSNSSYTGYGQIVEFTSINGAYTSPVNGPLTFNIVTSIDVTSVDVFNSTSGLAAASPTYSTYQVNASYKYWYVTVTTPAGAVGTVYSYYPRAYVSSTSTPYSNTSLARTITVTQ